MPRNGIKLAEAANCNWRKLLVIIQGHFPRPFLRVPLKQVRTWMRVKHVVCVDTCWPHLVWKVALLCCRCCHERTNSRDGFSVFDIKENQQTFSRWIQFQKGAGIEVIDAVLSSTQAEGGERGGGRYPEWDLVATKWDFPQPGFYEEVRSSVWEKQRLRTPPPLPRSVHIRN